MECSYCHKDRSDTEALRLSKNLIRKHILIGEYVNPGGRELIFSFGRINISDQCNWCDYKKIKKEIEDKKDQKE